MYDELITRLETTRPENYDIPSAFVYEARQAMLDAAAVIHQLQHHAADWERIADHWHKRCEELERQIREPSDASADAQSVLKGKWIRRCDSLFARCPNCGCEVMQLKSVVFRDEGRIDFCPNCGAKMDGDGE